MSRREIWIMVPIAASLLATIHGTPAATPTAACNDAHYHDFDFWLGDWDVYGAQGRLAGANHITREHGGCVIHEHYSTDRGYDGESLNTYDVARGLWHQTWVDSSGLLLVLEGGLHDGNMVLEGKVQGPGGKTVPQRITWSRGPQGTVHQRWEQQGADGAWSVVFDGTYVTRKAPADRG
jgi:hypothetical protein